jgi:hypothetical protein
VISHEIPDRPNPQGSVFFRFGGPEGRPVGW